MAPPPSACLVLIQFENTSSQPFTHISIGKPQIAPEQQLLPFHPISFLAPGSRADAHVAIDLAGSRQPLRFLLATDRGAFAAEIRPPMGEMVCARPHSPSSSLSPSPFGSTLGLPQVRPSITDGRSFDSLRARLGGMHETSALVRQPPFDANTTSHELGAILMRHMHAALVPPPSAEPPALDAIDGADGGGGAELASAPRSLRLEPAPKTQP